MMTDGMGRGPIHYLGLVPFCHGNFDHKVLQRGTKTINYFSPCPTTGLQPAIAPKWKGNVQWICLPNELSGDSSFPMEGIMIYVLCQTNRNRNVDMNFKPFAINCHSTTYSIMCLVILIQYKYLTRFTCLFLHWFIYKLLKGMTIHAFLYVMINNRITWTSSFPTSPPPSPPPPHYLHYFPLSIYGRYLFLYDVYESSPEGDLPSSCCCQYVIPLYRVLTRHLTRT